MTRRCYWWVFSARGGHFYCLLNQDHPGKHKMGTRREAMPLRYQLENVATLAGAALVVAVLILATVYA